MRRKRHLTWGEHTSESERLVNESGQIIGRICFSTYKTLCARPDDDPIMIGLDLDERMPRPPWVCSRCWAVMIGELEGFAEWDRLSSPPEIHELAATWYDSIQTARPRED